MRATSWCKVNATRPKVPAHRDVLRTWSAGVSLRVLYHPLSATTELLETVADRRTQERRSGFVRIGMFYEWPNPSLGGWQRLFEDSLEQIQYAEELGYDFVFVAEHHF